MSFAAIRDQIITELNAVAKIGRIHDFRRHTTTWEEMFQRHKDKGRINDWEVSRRETEQQLDSPQGLSGNEPVFRDIHTIIIQGAFSLKDSTESEKEFQDLVDAIIARFRLDTTLNGLLIKSVMMQGLIIEHRMFGGVLVHFAELLYQAEERVGG